MTATITPFPRAAAPAPVFGAWVHDLVRGRPMQVVGATISEGRPVAYTLFDPSIGMDVYRRAADVQFGTAHRPWPEPAA